MISSNSILQENGTNHVYSEIRDAVLIVNPNAGRGRRTPQLDEARHIFRNAGIETELQETTAPGEATSLARRAVERSRQLVVVCGGDGTVNEVVNGLAGSQVPLAVLPAGTANVVGVKNDLISIANAERGYYATEQKYASLDELISARYITIERQRPPYTYDVETTSSGFRVTATRDGAGGPAQFWIDETMQVQSSN